MTFKYSGERIVGVYHLSGNASQAQAKAVDITLEQTVELPERLIDQPEVRNNIFGRIEELRGIGDDLYEAKISYAVESAGNELTQLINLLFGNIGLKPGIRLESFSLPESLAGKFKGPRFGRAGVREWLKVRERPLLCTALKPMGLSAAELAEQAYQLALGGIDIIKDDHGLADQPFAPFEERVARCGGAVARANQKTGMNCVYAPNITAPASVIPSRARFAKECGAGALLICPGVAGLDSMRTVADDEEIGLPVLSHPSFQGSFVQSTQSGISHHCLFGQLNRLAGADAAIFPNYRGRFSFTLDDCRGLVAATASEMGHIKTIFPAPAGGMTLDRVPEMRETYGRDVIFLIGGGLRSYGADLVSNCRAFRKLAEGF